MKKKTLWILLGVLVIIQFFHPTKNNDATISTNHIYNQFATNNEVKTILAKACNDCHSNYTKYPWYINIQPVAWFLNYHINEGKHHLNFSEFGNYNATRKAKKMGEVGEVLKENEMPLSSYTLIHSDARLTDAEKATLINWAKQIEDSIKSSSSHSSQNEQQEND